MTASTPRTSRSACQSRTGSAPAYRTARAASVSSSDPGNVTTPIRTLEAYLTCPDQLTTVRFSGGAAQRARPLKALVEHAPGPLARSGAQFHVVDARPHDREPPPRF